ncbi:MAG: hypothetical protein U0792_05280 [Gemmataceae bacterium]
MTADEFVAALAVASRADKSNQLATRAWAKLRKRKKPAFEHPPDPVLDLLAWYNVSKLEFWQLKFHHAKISDLDNLWHVATKSTDDYFIETGSVLKMYYKEASPIPTGLSSSQFLELIVIYAQLIVAMPEKATGPYDPLLVEYAARATSISPRVAALDWFWESGRPIERKRWEWGIEGVILCADRLTWYEKEGPIRFASGGACDQSFPSFLKHGPAVSNTPADVLSEVTRAVKELVDGQP